MRWITALLIIILGIPQVSACLIEYRVVEFTPSNGVYVQNVKEDFVMNLTNPYNFTITDMNLSYRELNIRILKMSPKEVIYNRYDLKPEKFKVNVTYSVSGDHNGFKIKFCVRNDYDKSVRVKITFPKESWVKGCYNCSLNGEITFNSTIPPKSSSTFTLIGDGGLARLRDGRIQIDLKEVANITFSAPIPFSIEKTNVSDGVWFVNFSACNDLPLVANVTLIAYANESKPPHSLNESKKLFNFSSKLKPRGCISRYVKFNASTPGFFLKVVPLYSGTCNVSVHSSTKIGNNYVQYGIINGFTLRFAKPNIIPPAPAVGGGGGGTLPPIVGGGGTPISPSKPSKPQTPAKPSQPVKPVKPSEIPKRPSEIPLIFPVKSNVLESVKVFGVNVNRIKANKTVTLLMTVVPLIQSSLALLIPTIRKVVVFDRAEFTLEELESITGFIYVPARAKLGKIIPANIHFVQPDEEIVREIHETFDIPLTSAEAIAIALHYNAPAYLSDLKAVEVALSLGVEAYYKEVV